MLRGSVPVRVLAALAQFVLAAPSMRLGARVTAMEMTSYVSTYDSHGEEIQRVTYNDAYWGPNVEAVYGPVGWVYGRIELAGVRFYHAGGGALVAFPPSGLDVLVEPPLRWRLLPYVWGGVHYAGYWGSQGTSDPRFQMSEFGRMTSLYDLRTGLGLRYQLNNRLCLFAETQVWDKLTVLTYWPRELPQGVRFDGIGVLRADVGARYEFGAR